MFLCHVCSKLLYFVVKVSDEKAWKVSTMENCGQNLK